MTGKRATLACNWISVLLLIAGCARGSFACSTFVLRQGDHIVFGRNFDWSIGYGLVCVNHAGLRKVPLQTTPSSLSWTSKYGSVGFNQYGKEAPMDGMNQAGLILAQMWLDGTSYPAADSRPALPVLSWVQYQLDNCATVSDVIRTDSDIRISSGSSPLHFLVADRTGDAAVIEFLAGRMVVHRGDELPVRVLTNNTYDESVTNLREYTGFGGTLPIPTSTGSVSRFVRAADGVSRYGEQDAIPIVDYAFSILLSVAQPSTQWTIVFDMTDRKVHFKTKQSGDRKSFRMQALELFCHYTPVILDANLAQAGDVTDLFQPYTRAANRDLMYKAYRGTDFLRNTPDWVIDVLAAMPESFACCRPNPWAEKNKPVPPLQIRPPK